jgi:hypothetical protein
MNVVDCAQGAADYTGKASGQESADFANLISQGVGAADYTILIPQGVGAADYANLIPQDVGATDYAGKAHGAGAADYGSAARGGRAANYKSTGATDYITAELQDRWAAYESTLLEAMQMEEVELAATAAGEGAAGNEEEGGSGSWDVEGDETIAAISLPLAPPN